MLRQSLLLLWFTSALTLQCGPSYRRRALLNAGAALSIFPLGGTQPAAAKDNAAKSFIGKWKLDATKGPSAELVFLRNGEVELRDGSSKVCIGAVPWQYAAPKGGDSVVTLSWTLDCESERNVLIYQGTLDSAKDPATRVMEGFIETGRAELGASGGDYGRKRVGSFSAMPVLRDVQL